MQFQVRTFWGTASWSMGTLRVLELRAETNNKLCLLFKITSKFGYKLSFDVIPELSLSLYLVIKWECFFIIYKWKSGG